MAFNLGAFASGAAKGYLSSKELEEREKDREMRQQALDIQKAQAAREEERYQQEREARELLKNAYTPDTGGVSTQDITGALPIGQRAGETETTPEYRQAFQSAFGNLTPQQQAAVLQGYGSANTPGGQAAAAIPELKAAQLGTTTVRKGEDGQTYAAQPLGEREALVRYRQMAGASGNTAAMEKANQLYSQSLQTKQLERGEKRADKEDKFYDWLGNSQEMLLTKGPQATADVLAKEYNTGPDHKDGFTAKVIKNEDGSSVFTITNDKTGEVKSAYPVDDKNVGEAIKFMAFQKWSSLPGNFEKSLAETRENTKLGFEGRKVDIEASRLGMDAGKLGLEWEKFNLEVKNNPKKLAEMDAKIKNYNADANYRNALAKAAGEKTGNWAVIGTDKDGAPISYNKNDGSAARPDGKQIQDVEFFKKITGEKAAKEPITNKDVLDFVEKNGDAPSGIKDKNTGKELRVRELPLSQQRQAAEDFYQKGTGSGALPMPVVGEMKKPGEVPNAPAANPAKPEAAKQTAIPLRSTNGGKTYTSALPETIRDPSVPYYREIPNPLAYLNNITFGSRAEAQQAYENAMKNEAAAIPQVR